MYEELSIYHKKNDKKFNISHYLIIINSLLLFFIVTIFIINMYVYLYVIPTEFGGITELKSIEQKFNHIYNIIERICNQTSICN